MVRFNQSLRKTNYKNLALHGLFLLLLVIFMMTVGLKILINTSLFVANLTGRQTTNEEERQGAFLLPPSIVDIPQATNSAKIKILGTAQEGKTVEIFVNGDSQKEIIADDEGFETELNLRSGKNIVYAEVQDEKTKEKKSSDTHDVYYSNEKPELVIETPVNEERVTTNEITLTGKTDEGGSVDINDRPVVIGSDGVFSYNLRLFEGENKIEVSATNIYGNTTDTTLTITYQPD